jgi:two-component system chemotaxis response regulator CheB
LDAAIGGQGVSPSIDRAFASAAEVFRDEVTAVILTGIGRDGADGGAAVDAAGGRVIVQDQATSVVYGMPRAARESCGRATEAPIDGIAVAVARSVTARALGDGRRIRE